MPDTSTKHAFGEKANLENAITQGKVNEFDEVFLTDTDELAYVNKQKEVKYVTPRTQNVVEFNGVTEIGGLKASDFPSGIPAGKSVEDIPQVFTPYKEVLETYDYGLTLPEDVSIIWSDDDFGYMKRLSNSSERKRKGRSGVYYHVSYWGPPKHYLWIASTPPALMYEELEKAYRSTADYLWVVNVGDIKPAE